MSNRSYVQKLEDHIRHLEKAPDFDFAAAFGTEQPDDWRGLEEKCPFCGYDMVVKNGRIYCRANWDGHKCKMNIALPSPTKRESVKKYDPHLLGGCPLYTEEETTAMLRAFDRAKEHNGHIETLYAVATAVMRMRGHLPLLSKIEDRKSDG